MVGQISVDAPSIKFGPAVAAVVAAASLVSPLPWVNLLYDQALVDVVRPAYFDTLLLEPGTGSVTASFAGIPVLPAKSFTQFEQVGSDRRMPLENHKSSTGEAVRELQARAGLTWQQLAKALGVSRRTLHLWANDGPMSAPHSERLAKFERLVTKHDVGDPAATRLALLRSTGSGLSAYDRFRVDRDRDIPQINGSALSAAGLLAPNEPGL